MNVYPLTVRAFEEGEIDLLTATLMAQLVDDTYLFSTAHDFLDDVPSAVRISAPVAAVLDEIDVTGVVWLNDSLEWLAVPAGSTVAGVVFYVDTGTEATSRCLVHIDRRRDLVPIDFATNDGDIRMTWSRLFKL